jgi:signal transduction histidine kinase
MGAFNNLSIRSKITGIILLANVIGLGVAFILVVEQEKTTIGDNLIQWGEMLAGVVGQTHAVNLSFFEYELAEEDMARLREEEKVIEAWIWDADGTIFTGFPSEEVELPKPDPEKPISTFREDGEIDYVEVFANFQYVVDYDESPESLAQGLVCLRFSEERFQEALGDYYRRLGLVMLVVVVISIAFAFMLGRLVSGPILQLADVARRISRHGDYSIRVKKIGRDEIATLCDVFNEMLRQIQRRQLELERSNRELDHFAYVTSHDLKAPLRAISTLSAWIEEDLKDKVSGETAEQLELMRGRVKRMEQLIDGILEYSRVDRMDSDLEEVNSGALIGEVVEMLGLPESVKVEVLGEMPTFVTKRVRLQQVLANLVSNAVKYNGQKEPRVRISVRPTGHFYEFSVSDNGPGIAPAYHEKIFMIFQTLHSRDEVESTGVGLALVKKIVEGEGGTVSLESAEGMGCTFRFTWPKGNGAVAEEKSG